MSLRSYVLAATNIFFINYNTFEISHFSPINECTNDHNGFTEPKQHTKINVASVQFLLFFFFIEFIQLTFDNVNYFLTFFRFPHRTFVLILWCITVKIYIVKEKYTDNRNVQLNTVNILHIMK